MRELRLKFYTESTTVSVVRSRPPADYTQKREKLLKGRHLAFEYLISSISGNVILRLVSLVSSQHPHIDVTAVDCVYLKASVNDLHYPDQAPGDEEYV